MSKEKPKEPRREGGELAFPKTRALKIVDTNMNAGAMSALRSWGIYTIGDVLDSCAITDVEVGRLTEELSGKDNRFRTWSKFRAALKRIPRIGHASASHIISLIKDHAQLEAMSIRQEYPPSLRDHFAGLAMQGMLAHDTYALCWDEHADEAYAIADAMLKARDQ